jgi:ribosome-binding factor A
VRGDIHDPDLNRMSITVGAVGPAPPLRVGPACIMPRGGKTKDAAA